MKYEIQWNRLQCSEHRHDYDQEWRQKHRIWEMISPRLIKHASLARIIEIDSYHYQRILIFSRRTFWNEQQHIVFAHRFRWSRHQQLFSKDPEIGCREVLRILPSLLHLVLLSHQTGLVMVEPRCKDVKIIENSSKKNRCKKQCQVSYVVIISPRFSNESSSPPRGLKVQSLWVLRSRDPGGVPQGQQWWLRQAVQRTGELQYTYMVKQREQ